MVKQKAIITVRRKEFLTVLHNGFRPGIGLHQEQCDMDGRYGGRAKNI